LCTSKARPTLDRDVLGHHNDKRKQRRRILHKLDSEGDSSYSSSQLHVTNKI
jgi:hypothetical protein